MTTFITGTPQSFGVNSTLTVKSERNERDQFTRSGVNPNFNPNFVSSLMNTVAQQNGTYSSHPNLPTQNKTEQKVKTHRYGCLIIIDVSLHM